MEMRDRMVEQNVKIHQASQYLFSFAACISNIQISLGIQQALSKRSLRVNKQQPGDCRLEIAKQEYLLCILKVDIIGGKQKIGDLQYNNVVWPIRRKEAQKMRQNKPALTSHQLGFAQEIENSLTRTDDSGEGVSDGPVCFSCASSTWEKISTHRLFNECLLG